MVEWLQHLVSIIHPHNNIPHWTWVCGTGMRLWSCATIKIIIANDIYRYLSISISLWCWCVTVIMCHYQDNKINYYFTFQKSVSKIYILSILSSCLSTDLSLSICLSGSFQMFLLKEYTQCFCSMAFFKYHVCLSVCLYVCPSFCLSVHQSVLFTYLIWMKHIVHRMGLRLFSIFTNCL